MGAGEAGKGSYSKIGIALLLIARAVYSMQWYVLAPAMTALIAETNSRLSYSGLLPLAFIAGAAVSQMLGPYLSTRVGAKQTYVMGLAIVSIADVMVSVSRSLAEALAFRVAAGIGAGLFFSPAAYALLTLSGGPSPVLMGAYEVLFNIGGLLGIAWGVVDGALGWRTGIMLAGLLGLSLAALNALLVHLSDRPRSMSLSLRQSHGLLCVALAGAGAFGASYGLGALLPEIAHVTYGTSEYSTSLETLVYFIGNLLGSIVFTVSGARRATTSQMVGATVAMGVSFLPMITGSYEIFLVAVFINGAFTSLMFSVYYAYVVDRFSRANSASTLALVNMINMVGSLFIYPIMGLLLDNYWALPAFLAAVTMAPLLFLVAS